MENVTPGPWGARCIDDLTGPFFRLNGRGKLICEKGWIVFGPKTLMSREGSAFCEADAKFIARACNRFRALLLLAERVPELEREFQRAKEIAQSRWEHILRLNEEMKAMEKKP